MDTRLVEITEEDVARIEADAESIHAENCWPEPCRCFDFARSMRKRFEAAERSTQPA